MRHRPETWRLIAHIDEMAKCGLTGMQISSALCVPYHSVSVVAHKARISFTANRAESPLRRAIREGYAAGRRPSDIAAETGRPVTSVRVLACQMGLTRNTARDPFKHKRVFKIPEGRMDEYRALRRLGLTFHECGYEMGLLARQPVHPSAVDQSHFTTQESA